MPAPSSLEWLETNGLGGFAMGTVSRIRARRYHALLTAALRPPVARHVLVSEIEETLHLPEGAFELSANQYPGAVHPRGFDLLQNFERRPFPCWTYAAAGRTLTRELFLVHGEDTVVLTYTLDHPTPQSKLSLRPLLAFRDFHHLRREQAGWESCFGFEDGIAWVQPFPDLPKVFFSAQEPSCTPKAHWYRDFQYSIERDRGLDHAEDLFQPFELTLDLSSGRACVLVSLRAAGVAEAPQLRGRELARRPALAPPGASPFLQQLHLAADQFLVRRGHGSSILAGYPWFNDWGRDTMIALPGLTLATRRFAEARSILAEYGRAISQGMLPNRFPDSSEPPEYNTADATLWYFEAARAYLEATADEDFLRAEIYPHLVNIYQWHVRGTRYGIYVDRDGLLHAGAPGVQLTWMDAKVGDWVVTPRHGKPVEIQALWYNALRILHDLASRFEDSPLTEGAGRLSQTVRQSFREQFWREETGALYDVIDGAQYDASIRPNMIFALSLPYSMLDSSHALRILDTVRRHLLTPMGLRTLSPHDPQYQPRYAGSVRERDSAYHQGTVWPWLMGPYLTAVRRYEPASAEPRAWLENFAAHLNQACIGQISEIADAAPPHAPNGCPAQAWSVAELLRAATTVL